MTATVPGKQTFWVDLGPFRRYCRNIALTFLVMISAAMGIGLWRAGRVPSASDVIFSLSIGPAAGLVLYAFMWAIVRAYPVEVGPDGILASTPLGRSITVPWRDIKATGAVELYGMPYLVLHCEGRQAPLTICLWIKDAPRFLEAIRTHAGADHILVQDLAALYGVAMAPSPKRPWAR